MTRRSCLPWYRRLPRFLLLDGIQLERARHSTEPNGRCYIDPTERCWERRGRRWVQVADISEHRRGVPIRNTWGASLAEAMRKSNELKPRSAELAREASKPAPPPCGPWWMFDG